MSAITDALNSSLPTIFHRQYGNDLENFPNVSRKISQATGIEQTWIDQSTRAAIASLPLLALYKPLSLPLSLVMGGMRTVGSISQLLESYQTNDLNQLAPAVVQTIVSVAAVAATIFAHPMGMVITTGHDLLIEICRVIEFAQNGQYEQLAESCLTILNNSLYLALMLDGGLKLAIAALSMQILVGIYHAQAELRKENYIEATGHILMALVRCNQLAACLSIPAPKPMQVKLNDAQLLEKARETGNKELIDALEKYHDKGRFVPAIYNAIDACDWKAMELIVNNNGLVEYPNLSGSPKLHPQPLLLALSKQAHPSLKPTAHNIEVLIKGGANTNIDYFTPEYKKWTGHNQPVALFLIAQKRNDLLELCLKHGMNASSTFYHVGRDESILSLTVKDSENGSESRLEAIKILLKYKADPDFGSPLFFTTVLHSYYGTTQATREYYVQVLRELLGHGANPHKVAPLSHTATPYNRAHPELKKIFDEFKKK
ncbi:MAG: hypothetical protein HYX48_04400 [Chlamydiales bacterium]|nr:hypothetical protein [Chlamydiales bacterium]